jgi:hypothetical protein
MRWIKKRRKTAIVECREESQPQEQEEDQQIHPLGQYI